jgi:hypothetical protein
MYVAANDRAVEDVGGGKQCRCAVALVIVGHGTGAALLQIWLFSSTERTTA